MKTFQKRKSYPLVVLAFFPKLQYYQQWSLLVNIALSTFCGITHIVYIALHEHLTPVQVVMQKQE